MFLDAALLIVYFPPVHVYARMCACVYRQIFSNFSSVNKN